MATRHAITADVIRTLLIGVTPGDWNIRESSIGKGGQLVAPRGVVGGICSLDDLKLLARAPEIAEYAVRVSDERDFLLRERDCDQRKLSEQARRIEELERLLDDATATDDDEFPDEMRRATSDVIKEH